MINFNLFSVFGPIQWTIIIILIVVMIALLASFIYFLYLIIFKPDVSSELSTMEKIFKEEKKRLLSEKRMTEEEIRRHMKDMDNKEERVRKLETEAELMHEELLKQGLKEEEAKRVADMSLEELVVLKNEEMKDVSGDFVINAITRKILIDKEFEVRDDVRDFKVPLAKTTGDIFNRLEPLLQSLTDIEYTEAKGKAGATYKVSGKSFAILYNLGEGNYKLTIKCGPFYGQRLTALYKFFEKAKFPYGMLWFSMNNGGSLELAELLIAISYNIAKAGY
ncbi:MAG: hypothetical protein FWE36_06710 [Erysipelotrichales bacterium]|nr:hypothetical protein [Erysipelotrichales bacterium]